MGVLLDLDPLYASWITLAIGAGLTSLLIPLVKESIDRRREQFKSSVTLVDDLAEALWGYWKDALRIAYYDARTTANPTRDTRMP
jgi:hypothetical protein